MTEDKQQPPDRQAGTGRAAGILRNANLSYHFEKLYEGSRYRLDPGTLDQSQALAVGNVLKSRVALELLRRTLDEFKKALLESGQWDTYEVIRDEYDLADHALARLEGFLTKEGGTDIRDVEVFRLFLKGQLDTLTELAEEID